MQVKFAGISKEEPDVKMHVETPNTTFKSQLRTMQIKDLKRQ